MKELQNEKYKFREHEVLSFVIDKETLDKFRNLIYDLEEQGVYMDFIWEEDSKFTNDENRILHIIEDDSIKANWNEVSEKCYEYYKSNIVTVDLQNTPEIYFIFVTIILNKTTNIVFNFYEGEGDAYISFFKNKHMQDIRDSYNNSDIDENLEDDNLELNLECHEVATLEGVPFNLLDNLFRDDI